MPSIEYILLGASFIGRQRYGRKIEDYCRNSNCEADVNCDEFFLKVVQ